MLAYDPRDPEDFRAPETAAALQPDRIEPELGDIIVAFYVDMRWLLPIARIEKEPVGAGAEDSRHALAYDSAPVGRRSSSAAIRQTTGAVAPG